ncbi:hypothetical protein DFH06DRAFT_1340938 [Mycena polygramma]|nr:hypothetical protein DFH06DRAFT_1340938 [Mycena polygramma]
MARLDPSWLGKRPRNMLPAATKYAVGGSLVVTLGFRSAFPSCDQRLKPTHKWILLTHLARHTYRDNCRRPSLPSARSCPCAPCLAGMSRASLAVSPLVENGALNARAWGDACFTSVFPSTSRTHTFVPIPIPRLDTPGELSSNGPAATALPWLPWQNFITKEGMAADGYLAWRIKIESLARKHNKSYRVSL